MKGIRTKPSFLDRRRARQGRGAASGSYTFELAALHLRLLVAMAAVDEEVRHVEVEEITAFIDRTTLPHADVERLETVTREALADPPRLESLLEGLEMLVRRPALAKVLVTDLARVAAADARADPREVVLLRYVCDALRVEHVSIDIPEPELPRHFARGTAPTPLSQRQPRLINQHRVRTAVRTALDASYRDQGGR